PSLPLRRSVVWSYASYILGTNLAFGILSVSAPSSLLDGSVLARAVCAFIAVYWSGRVAVHFFVFSRSIAAPRPLFRFAEIAYVTGFIYLALVYSLAAVVQR